MQKVSFLMTCLIYNTSATAFGTGTGTFGTGGGTFGTSSDVKPSTAGLFGKGQGQSPSRTAATTSGVYLMILIFDDTVNQVIFASHLLSRLLRE